MKTRTNYRNDQITATSAVRYPSGLVLIAFTINGERYRYHKSAKLAFADIQQESDNRRSRSVFTKALVTVNPYTRRHDVLSARIAHLVKFGHITLDEPL